MNAYLALLFIIIIIVFSNLITFAIVRGARGMNIGWLKNTKNSFTKPFQTERDQLNELRKSVEDLSQSNDE